MIDFESLLTCFEISSISEDACAVIVGKFALISNYVILKAYYMPQFILCNPCYAHVFIAEHRNCT